MTIHKRWNIEGGQTPTASRPPISQIFGGPIETPQALNSIARRMAHKKANSVVYESESKKMKKMNMNRNFADLPSYMQIGSGPTIRIEHKGLGKKTSLPVEANLISKGNTFDHLNLDFTPKGAQQSPTQRSLQKIQDSLLSVKARNDMYQVPGLPETPFDLIQAGKQLASAKYANDQKILGIYNDQMQLSNHHKYGYKLFKNADFRNSVATPGQQESKHKEAGFIMNSLSEIENQMHKVSQKEITIQNPLSGANQQLKLPPMIIDPVPKFKQTYMDLIKDSKDPFNRRLSDLVDVSAISGNLVPTATRLPSRTKTMTRRGDATLQSMAESAATQAMMEHLMPGLSRGGVGLSRGGLGSSPRSRKITRGLVPTRGSLPVTAKNEYRREPNIDEDSHHEDGPVDERDLDALIRANQKLALKLQDDSSDSEYNNTKYNQLRPLKSDKKGQTKMKLSKAESIKFDETGGVINIAELGGALGIDIQAREDFFPAEHEKRVSSQMTINPVTEIRRERNPTTQEDLQTDELVAPELDDLKRKFNTIDNESATVGTSGQEPDIYQQYYSAQQAQADTQAYLLDLHARSLTNRAGNENQDLNTKLKELGGVFKPVPPTPGLRSRGTPMARIKKEETEAKNLKGAIMPDVRSGRVLLQPIPREELSPARESKFSMQSNNLTSPRRKIPQDTIGNFQAEVQEFETRARIREAARRIVAQKTENQPTVYRSPTHKSPGVNILKIDRQKKLVAMAPSPGSKLYCERVTLRNNKVIAFD